MDALYTTNKILIDWLSFTISNIDIEELMSLFGFDEVSFADLNGGRGYKHRYYYDGVSIHYDGREEDADYWVEISGQGCRVFESYGHGDWIYLFSNLLNRDVNITRLDVAYDDFNGLIDLNSIVADTLAHNYISKADNKSWFVELSGEGTCVTIGKSKSQICCRIYDKAAERHREHEIDHWVRCELQLRYGNAMQFCTLLCKHQSVMPVFPKESVFAGVSIHDGISIDRLYFGVLNNYLRFIDPEKNNDTNLWRAPCAEHWVKFAHSVTDERISLWVKPGVDYNVMRLDRVVENMFSGATCTYALIHGIDKLVETLINRLPYLNVKYKYLLKQHFYSNPDITCLVDDIDNPNVVNVSGDSNE